jgi:hypothetical protein
MSKQANTPETPEVKLVWRVAGINYESMREAQKASKAKGQPIAAVQLTKVQPPKPTKKDE